jgi:hypothetical protein
MRTTKLGLRPVKTLQGIPVARNKPQRERIDAFGRVKPIGSYAIRCDHPEADDPCHAPGTSRWCDSCQQWVDL